LKGPSARQGPPADTSTSGGPPPFYVTEVQAKGTSSLANVIQVSIGFSVSVLDLPSGTIKTWTQADRSTGADVYATPLSWAADGSRLVLNYQLPGGSRTEVR
jgi:hypothetical protein